MEIRRGMRDKMDKYISINQNFEVCMSIDGKDEYDFSCFGVDENDKLSDERYMVFYNQLKSPNDEIQYIQHDKNTRFIVCLSKLPLNINKLVFTSNIYGDGTMKSIKNHTVKIIQNNQEVITLELNGTDFNTEKAIISIEIYRKQNEWRFNAVARGFNGGLGDLLRFFGGEESSSQPQTTVIENTKNDTNSDTNIKIDAKSPQEPVIDAKPVQKPVIDAKPAQKPVIDTKPVQKAEKISLKKGQKISLTKNENDEAIVVENGWSAARKDYDLKALVRYRDGRLVYVGAANKDEVLSTNEGAVKHGGDVKKAGELEHIYIKWHPDIASVAVSSYSALENGPGSFYRYGVYVRIRNGKQIVEIPATDVSANDRSYTLCFGEIIFGQEKGAMEVVALEMYSAPNSERRIGYKNGVVVMDIGPVGKVKGSLFSLFFG